MASSFTRSSLSFRREGSSGFVWRDGCIPQESHGSCRSTAAINNNVHAAADGVLSENMLKQPQISTNQVFCHSGSVGSNLAPSAASAHRHEDHRTYRRVISSPGARENTNSRFRRWVKRTFSKSSSALS